MKGRGLYRKNMSETDAHSNLPSTASKRMAPVSSSDCSSDENDKTVRPARKKKQPAAKKKQNQDALENESDENSESEMSYILKPDRDFYNLTFKDVSESKCRTTNMKCVVSIPGKIRKHPNFIVRYMQIELMTQNKRQIFLKQMNDDRKISASISKPGKKMNTEIKITGREVTLTSFRMPLKIYEKETEFENTSSKSYGKKAFTFKFDENDNEENCEKTRKLAIASASESWILGISVLNRLPRADESLFNNKHDDFDEEDELLDVPSKLGTWMSLKSVYVSKMETLARNWTYRLILEFFFANYTDIFVNNFIWNSFVRWTNGRITSNKTKQFTPVIMMISRAGLPEI